MRIWCVVDAHLVCIFSCLFYAYYAFSGISANKMRMKECTINVHERMQNKCAWKTAYRILIRCASLILPISTMLKTCHIISPPGVQKTYRHSQWGFQIWFVRGHFICQSNDYGHSILIHFSKNKTLLWWTVTCYTKCSI